MADIPVFLILGSAQVQLDVLQEQWHMRKAYGPGTEMFQFGGAAHDRDVFMGIAAECIVKLVSGEIGEGDAKSWCEHRVTTL